MRLARNGDVDGFSAYVRTDEFLTAFNGLNPGRRQSALRCYGRAEALCEARAGHPLAKPGPIDAKRTQKVNWGDPACAPSWRLPMPRPAAMTRRLHASSV